jgi:hypothetical protein
MKFCVQVTVWWPLRGNEKRKTVMYDGVSASHFHGVVHCASFLLKVHESYISTLERADQSLGKAFEAAKGLGGQAREIEITLSAGRRNHTLGLGSNIVNATKRLLSADDMRTGVVSGEIKAKNDVTGLLETIDFLSDRLVVKKNIPLNQYWGKKFLMLEGLVAVLLGIVFYIWIKWSSGFLMGNQVLDGNRSAVYGALASIFGSLLGFVITALSIIIGYSANDKLQFLKKTRHYSTLWKVLTKLSPFSSRKMHYRFKYIYVFGPPTNGK